MAISAGWRSSSAFAEDSCMSGGMAAFMAARNSSAVTVLSSVTSISSCRPTAPVDRAEAKVIRICGLKPLL